MVIIISDDFINAVNLFNKEDFYGQHDVLEALWINCKKQDIRRLLYQGILNVGVGFYHFTLYGSNDGKNHLRGCKKQLIKGLARLNKFNETSKKMKFAFANQLIDCHWVQEFIELTNQWLDWLTHTKNLESHPQFPKIKLYNNFTNLK